MSKFIVYCLYSDIHDRLYIGQTGNIEKRYKQHCSGRVISTRKYLPYRIIYIEEVPDRASAFRREKELKVTSQRKFLRTFINK
ncbi:MAG: GIY-YIG nuclease family protein [Ignavibacteria bacterium]